jgi:hypothetical protein
MPVIDVELVGGQPLIGVYVGVSEPRAQALMKAGRSVPPPVYTTLLIDTGASSTCIDGARLGQLELDATGLVEIETPSTRGVPHSCQGFDVSLQIRPQTAGLAFVIPALPIIETGGFGFGFDGLLGRDVLSQCILIYNGVSKRYVLSY